MNLNTQDYVVNALKTESVDFEKIGERLQDQTTIRILHAAMGVSTESNELLDTLKKHIFYGKPLDIVNLGEEAGDLFWYLAILADAIGQDSFNRIMETNIAKLKARYGAKFSEDAAINRNLDAELKILGAGSGTM